MSPSARGLAQPSQDHVLSDGEIISTLRALRSEMLDLIAQVAGKDAAATRLNRRVMNFESYRQAFESYSAKIDDSYRRLSGCYEQISRVYRANPNSVLYKQMVKTYLDAKAIFDNLKSTFSALEPPEQTITEAVISNDTRLNERVSASMRSADAPPAPAQAAKEIVEADDSRFIGTFDAVEMFLLVRGDTACYVLFGWKDVVNDDNGKSIEEYHLSVVRSEAFPITPAVRAMTAEQHLENALKLKIALVEAQGETLTDIKQFFARAKSYTRTN
ncbi:MAG: hypothetical protein CFK52_06150 [Chloracidobacterium sp. CP2_5A]|nr:MAG: hypothetical protein CFK52_06150 [Chloracidobacterium sp. CP2_5A]